MTGIVEERTPMVECTTLLGERILVPREQIGLRLSVYGVVLWQKNVLLVHGRTSGRLWFPGGGVKAWESLEETLIREIEEETGLKIQISSYLTFKEEFFYHDVWKKAFHSLRFYLSCSPLTFNLVSDDKVNDGESLNPRWFNIDDLTPSSFDQNYGLEILQLAIQYL